MTTLQSPVPLTPLEPLAADNVIARFGVDALAANLLPDEVEPIRALLRLQRRVRLGLALLVVVLTAVCTLCWWQARNAARSVPRAHAAVAGLDRQLAALGPIATVEKQFTEIESTLTSVFAQDLAWPQLLARIRSAAPPGISVDDVDATLVQAGAGDPNHGTGLNVLNTSGRTVLGTVSADGVARDKAAVGAYLDALTHEPGIAAPYLASASQTGGSVSYTITMLITADALTHRFAPVQTGSLR